MFPMMRAGIKKLVSLLELPFSRRQKHAMERRSGVSLEEFRSGFPEAEKEAEELWKELQSVAVVDGFCPAPDDDLLGMYGLADEDLDEVIVCALSRLGYQVPKPEEIKDMEAVRTVNDAVLFLKWCGERA